MTHSRLHALETCVYACDTAVCSNGLHRSPGSELLVCDSYCCVWCRVVSAIFEWKDSVTMPQRCARACSQPMPLVTRVCAHIHVFQSVHMRVPLFQCAHMRASSAQACFASIYKVIHCVFQRARLRSWCSPYMCMCVSGAHTCYWCSASKRLSFGRART